MRSLTTFLRRRSLSSGSERPQHSANLLYPTLSASRIYPRMRASSFRHLRWVAIPVRSPWSRPLGRAHPFRHVLHFTRSSPPQNRRFSASTPTQLIREGDSTIYALSTAPGRAAIAVVRVSGPHCVLVCGIVLHYPQRTPSLTVSSP
jgi:hypothetical protein